MVKRAKDEAKNLVNLAENKSKSRLEETILSAKKECERLRVQAQEDIKSELDVISNTSKERCKEIVDIPQAKFDAAKKILIERIVK